LFCSRCGGGLRSAPPVACDRCGYRTFANPRPSGGVVIVQGGRFLAVRRAREPQAGRWELPGGFCGGTEHPADAAVREAREELGVDVALADFLGMWLTEYEYQDETLCVLDCFWLARIVAGEIALDPAEASAHCWLSLRDAPPLAFRSMDAAIKECAGRV
jgi:8-oxo-dGTP diphosphatase